MCMRGRAMRAVVAAVVARSAAGDQRMCLAFTAQHKSAGSTINQVLKRAELRWWPPKAGKAVLHNCDEFKYDDAAQTCSGIAAAGARLRDQPHAVDNGLALSVSDARGWTRDDCVWLTAFRDPISRLASAQFYCGYERDVDPLCGDKPGSWFRTATPAEMAASVSRASFHPSPAPRPTPSRQVLGQLWPRDVAPDHPVAPRPRRRRQRDARLLWGGPAPRQEALPQRLPEMARGPARRRRPADARRRRQPRPSPRGPPDALRRLRRRRALGRVDAPLRLRGAPPASRRPPARLPPRARRARRRRSATARAGRASPRRRGIPTGPRSTRPRSGTRSRSRARRPRSARTSRATSPSTTRSSPASTRRVARVFFFSPPNDAPLPGPRRGDPRLPRAPRG